MSSQNSLKLRDFVYELPEELIAKQPVSPRDSSRLMVVDRTKGTIEHRQVRDVGEWIKKEDLLVLNNSKVIPARLSAMNGSVEILLTEETSPRHWLCIGKPGKKIRLGQRLIIDPRVEGYPPIEAEILRILPDGQRVLRLFGDLVLDAYGVLPLPPYIEDARAKSGEPIISENDKKWYQTVYAKTAGSVAAPTAGLHFTPELLGQFNHEFITLHVGLGTFRPVKVENIEEHEMHTERYTIPEGLAEKAKLARRVVAVGTTTARVMESVPSLKACTGETKIFIHPPYTPKRTDVLMTNFHLPGSTLLMLVAGFMGLELQREAYRIAVEEKYRFFSYGDAMLIL